MGNAQKRTRVDPESELVQAHATVVCDAPDLVLSGDWSMVYVAFGLLYMFHVLVFSFQSASVGKGMDGLANSHRSCVRLFTCRA